MAAAPTPAREASRWDLLPVGMVLGAACSLQLGAATATTLFDELGSAGTVLLRLVFAAAVLLVLWRPALRGRGRRTWLLVAVFGLAVAGLNLTFYAAIDRIPLGIAATLAFTGPLMLAVVSSRRPADIAWVVLAGTGIVILAPWNGQSLDTTGAALALLNGAFWACYILLATRVGRSFSGGAGLALALAVAAVAVLPLGLSGASAALGQPQLLAVGAAVAILSSAIPYSLEMEALRRLPAGTFGVLMSLQPGVAALIGFLALGQGLSASEALAISFVVVASAGAISSSRAPAPIDP